jgi:FAD/FMN-containing dehydrogenase
MIDAAEVVTVDGNRRWVSADAEPDLLWALKGGGGNFGVVTTLRLRLVSQPMVFAGAIYWPIGKARELLTTYRDWVATSARLTWARQSPSSNTRPAPLCQSRLRASQ